MKTILNSYLKAHKGQAMTENIIIISLIAIGCMAGFILYQQSISTTNKKIGDKLTAIDTGTNTQPSGNTTQQVLTDKEKEKLKNEINRLRREARRLSSMANLIELGGVVTDGHVNADQLADINSKTAILLRIEAARLEAKLKNDPDIITLEMAKISTSESVQSAIDMVFENVPLPPQVQWVADWVRLPIRDGSGQLSEYLIEYTFD
ncbi:MAG: hypothetical protein HQK75_10730 [Candidatus Magnetomorum sp.]|nr:hypothetical protein [Candidatus Magnetomorum sp.]